MKMKHFILLFLFFAVLSCKKDSAGGITLKIKSVSSSVVPIGSDLQVILDFTDNNGQPIDTVYYQKVRLNQRPVPPDQLQKDTFWFSAPSYQGTTKGELQIDLDYENLLKDAVNPYMIDSVTYESDSLKLRFAIQDAGNHKSDTVSTGLIVIQRTQ